jgi:hypothetical protein
MHEYVEAEEIGRGINGPGECFPYYKDCPKSLFRNRFESHLPSILQKRKLTIFHFLQSSDGGAF